MDGKLANSVHEGIKNKNCNPCTRRHMKWCEGNNTLGVLDGLQHVAHADALRSL